MRVGVQQESPRTHPRESSFVSLMSGWAQQGVQSFFATQRILLDLAMRQPMSVMNTLKERMAEPRHSPTAVLTELAGEGLSNFMTAQKVLLDLLQQQNDIVMTGVKERIGDSSAALAMTDLLRQRIDTVIQMQREFLKIAGRQTHTWVEEAATGKVSKTVAVTDLAREAMESFIDAEKQFLDAVAEEAKRAAHGKRGVAKKTKKSDLMELGRRATESLIEAQKAIVDVAGRQMNANLKMASRTMDILGPFPILPISDWTREGLKTFTETQEALMDAVTKPRNGSEPVRKRPRAARTRRSAKAKTVV